LPTGAQDVVFQTMLLEEITGVRKPSIMLEDNTRAIFLVRNQQVGPRTKHIDVRHHFIRELHEDGSLMVKYTESEDNEADMMTKNVAMLLLVKHRENLRNGSMFVKIFIMVMFSNAMNPLEILPVLSLRINAVPGPYARSRSASLGLPRLGQT